MKKPTILIVDDEPDLRDAIAFDFHRKNFQVLTAGCGEEAFGIVEGNEIDVVLSDVRMPKLSGIELLEKIKVRNPFRPVVILITGFADLTLEEAFEKGADAVFPKPYDRKLLMEAAIKALHSTTQPPMRRSSRVEIEIPVELQIRGESIRAKIVNIGRGGIFAEFDELPLMVSDEVSFTIEAASIGLPVKMSGRGVVRWVRGESRPSQPTGCGIEFLELEPDSSKHMINLINFTKTKSFMPIK